MEEIKIKEAMSPRVRKLVEDFNAGLSGTSKFKLLNSIKDALEQDRREKDHV